MKNWTKDSFVDAAFIVAILFLAIFVRLPLLPLETMDYQCCLAEWMDKIREYGAWKSLGMRISDYSPAYMYVMCLVSGFGNTLYALKGVSILFDFAAGLAMFFLVRELTGNRRKGIAAMAAALLCPTVIFNGAWWCQCDIIYVTFMLLSLLFLFREKSILSCLMLGIAFSFKVQAVFLLPFFVILSLKGKTVRFWHLLLVPAVFFVSLIPSWMAGRPLGDLLGVYFLQAGEYPFGTMHFPNFYEFLHESNVYWHHLREVGVFGLCFSFGVLALFAYWAYHRKFRLTPQVMVTLALFSICLVLFTMPHMHERYGLVVDLLAIVYAAQRPGKAPLAAGYILVSLLSYIPYLNHADPLPAIWLAVALLGLNILLGRDLLRQVNENR